MTAQRWWVKSFARWQARIDSVKGQIQAVSLAVTAFSTFSLVLQGFGMGRFVPFVAVIGTLLGPLYAYIFFEGGVWNQVSRDRADMSGNFAGPGSRISAELMASGLAPLVLNREPTEEERQRMNKELDRVFIKYRDGVGNELLAADNGESPETKT